MTPSRITPANRSAERNDRADSSTQCPRPSRPARISQTTDKISATVTLGLRGEIWSDKDAFYVAQFGNYDDVMNGLRGTPLNDPRTVGGGSTTYCALTFGAQIQLPVAKPFAGLVIRPELRYDRSSKTPAFDDSTKKSQFTFGVDAVLTF